MNKLLSKTRTTRIPQILTLAFAVFSTSSPAVMLNPDGQGEVLLFPYYSVNAGQQSFISLVNQSNAGKAVKLHFRESHNGRATLSLNVYMSEFDVWTAALIAIPGQDGAALITARASGVRLAPRRPPRSAKKLSAMLSVSSGRSRSGGTVMGKAARR